MIWLASFVTFPAPMGPTRVTEAPSLPRIGRTFSNTALLPSDHYRERAIDSLGLSARNRRVEHGDAMLFQSRRDFLGNGGRDRTHVHDDHILAFRFKNAFQGSVFSKDSFFHMWRNWEAW